MLSFRSLTTPQEIGLVVDRRPPRPEVLALREARRLRKGRRP